MCKPVANLVDVKPRHVTALLAHIREADRVELEAIRGWTVEHELIHAIDKSSRARACICDGKVLAIFGDVAHDSVYGLPWMVSSTWIEAHRRAFLTECVDVVADMRTRHQRLINFADVRNTQAVRWLKWLGFTFLPAIPYGVNQELFYPFEMEGTACAQ
jgi:hypothetical protein